MRFPHLAHRSAAAHKLHSTPQQDRINLISGNHQTSSRLPAFSLFLPGSCPNNRDHRREPLRPGSAACVDTCCLAWKCGQGSTARPYCIVAARAQPGGKIAPKCDLPHTPSKLSSRTFSLPTPWRATGASTVLLDARTYEETGE